MIVVANDGAWLSFSCHGSRPALLLHGVEHPRVLLEMNQKIAPHGIEDFGKQRIFQGVKDLVLGFSGVHQPLGAQKCQVLRDIGLLDFYFVQNGADGEFALPQCFNDVNAGGVSQDLKNISLEPAQRLQVNGGNQRFTFHLLSIFELAHIGK